MSPTTTKRTLSNKSQNMKEQKVENKEKRRKKSLEERKNVGSKDEVCIIAPAPVDSLDEIKVDPPSQYCKVPELNKSPEWTDKQSLLKEDTPLQGSLLPPKKDNLGIDKLDVKVIQEPVLSKNKYRTAIIDIGGTHYRSKITNFTRYPASRLGKIFRATSIDEILLHCDAYTPGNPPVLYFDKSKDNFTSILDLYRFEELHLC
jgi:hypothetical protein